MSPISDAMANNIKAYSDLFRVENSLTGLIGVVIGAVVVNGIDFTLGDVMIVSFLVCQSCSSCSGMPTMTLRILKLID